MYVQFYNTQQSSTHIFLPSSICSNIQVSIPFWALAPFQEWPCAWFGSLPQSAPRSLDLQCPRKKHTLDVGAGHCWKTRVFGETVWEKTGFGIIKLLSFTICACGFPDCNELHLNRVAKTNLDVYIPGTVLLTLTSSAWLFQAVPNMCLLEKNKWGWVKVVYPNDWMVNTKTRLQSVVPWAFNYPYPNKHQLSWTSQGQGLIGMAFRTGFHFQVVSNGILIPLHDLHTRWSGHGWNILVILKASEKWENPYIWIYISCIYHYISSK